MQPQSETVWRQADRYGVPRIAFINKMDRIGADFFRAVGTIRDRLGAKPVPLQIPIGREDEFRGVVDLIEGKAIIFDDQTMGAKYVYEEIPADLMEQYKELRFQMVESIAEEDEGLMEKYLVV